MGWANSSGLNSYPTCQSVDKYLHYHHTIILTVVRSAEFIDWLFRLRDRQARVRIAARLDRIQTTGNLGDSHSVGGDVSELRFNVGPGYRVYFTRKGNTIVVLLCAGDKDTQSRNIARARRMASEWNEA